MYDSNGQHCEVFSWFSLRSYFTGSRSNVISSTLSGPYKNKNDFYKDFPDTNLSKHLLCIMIWRKNISPRNIIIRMICMGLVFQNNKDCRMLFRLSYKPCKVNEVNEQRTCHSSHVKNGDVFCTHIFLQYCINWKGLPLHFHAWEAETFFTTAVLVGYSMLN